ALAHVRCARGRGLCGHGLGDLCTRLSAGLTRSLPRPGLALSGPRPSSGAKGRAGPDGGPQPPTWGADDLRSVKNFVGQRGRDRVLRVWVESHGRRVPMAADDVAGRILSELFGTRLLEADYHCY